MKNSRKKLKVRNLIAVIAALCALTTPFLSRAQPLTVSITVANNSNREIRHVYLSHVNADDWSADKLTAASIQPGQSYVLQNVSCDQGQIKVIGEDKEGCFLSGVVSCGSDATWTITNETPADCGQ